MKNTIATYRSRGWATIRVQPLGKRPIGAWQTRTDDPEDFQRGENVGVRLGKPSGGLVDVDLDCDEAVALAPLFLPPTATFGRVSKRRSHWVYNCADAGRTRKPPRTSIELRGDGGQTVFPPSIHETGEPIEWTDETPVAEIAIADLLPAFGRLAVATVIAKCWPRLEGERHDAVLALAGALWRENVSVEDARALLLPAMGLDGSAAEHRPAAIDDTWGEHDRQRYGWPAVQKLLGSPDSHAIQRAVELFAADPKPADGSSFTEQRPLTDMGNAERLLDEHGADLKYVPGIGWLRWDGARWDQPLGEPAELVGRSARKLQAYGATVNQPALSKWGHQSESLSRCRATLGWAKELKGFQAKPSELDSNPWDLCVANGVIDLRTGNLRAHDPGDLITKIAPIDYDPAALAPRFVQFLGEVFQGDTDLIQYVLRFLGYSMTGRVSEQVFGLWYGEGANGKSVLLETVRYVLGDYARALASDLLIERRTARASEAASPDVARMRGSRFAAGVETKAGQRWNESLVKQLTGDDVVVARHLYQQPIEFDPTWAIVLAVNHLPIVRGTDEGIWRRIHLVPFRASFLGAKADRTLRDKLRAEAPGILAILVQACLEWQRGGLSPPGSVQREVKAYRENQDVIGSFLEESTRESERERVPMAQFYREYRQWAADSGEHVYGKHAFNNQMRSRGWREVKVHGKKCWAGLALLSTGRFGAAA